MSRRTPTRPIKRVMTGAAVVVIALGVTGCGDDDEGGTDQPPPPATGANAVPEGNDGGGSEPPFDSVNLGAVASDAPFNPSGSAVGPAGS